MPPPKPQFYSLVTSPVDTLLLTANDRGLTGLYFDGERALNERASQGMLHKPRKPVLTTAKRQLREYFRCKRQKFALPLEPNGTEFQRAVWECIALIPYGETATYAELAIAAGRPGAARAAGGATGSNPIAIIVPCHRVIGTSGALTGFGGGLPRKIKLLRLELGDFRLTGGGNSLVPR